MYTDQALDKCDTKVDKYAEQNLVKTVCRNLVITSHSLLRIKNEDEDSGFKKIRASISLPLFTYYILVSVSFFHISRVGFYFKLVPVLVQHALSGHRTNVVEVFAHSDFLLRIAT